MAGKPERYKALARDLHERIKGTPAGSLLPGIQVLAHEHAANFKTINRAIKLLIDQGLLHRIRGKGTFVCQQGALANRRTRWHGRMGLMFPNSANPFFLAFATELNAICWQRGFALVTCDAMNTKSMETDFLDLFQKAGGKQIVRFPNVLPAEREVLERVSLLGLRLVMANDFWSRGNGFPHVAVDECRGVEMAVSHLHALGHRRIAFVDDEAEVRRRALEAYRKALSALGLPRDPRLVILAPTCRQSASRLAELLRSPAAPDAALFLYDADAICTIAELEQLNVRVPRDLSVIGFDDLRFSSDPGIQLTTLQQPTRELASAAFDLLLSGETREVLIPPRLIVRKTTVPRVAGPSAAEASDRAGGSEACEGGNELA